MKSLFHIFLFTIFLLSIFSACKDEEKIALQKLSEEVISIHDEVMPKTTGAMHEIKKKLSGKLETTDSTVIFEAIKKLDNADEAMNVWMQEYNSMNDTLDNKSRSLYLKDELRKIKKVRSMVLESIKEANDLIDKNK
jgi:hypothetical protein